MGESEGIVQQCYTVVEKLANGYDWQLLSVDELTHILAEYYILGTDTEKLEHGQTLEPEQIRKLAIYCYCLHALHPAALGLQGVQKRQRAFAELATYLYPIAYRTWPQVAEDATQDALVAIFERAHLCRNGGAFLAFCIQKVRDAARRRLRLGAREFSLDQLLEQDARGDASGHLATVDDTAEATLTTALRTEVIKQIRALRAEQPRARRQLDAVWLRYIQELSMNEIAQHLETPVENVSVLLSRGLDRLRQDTQLLALSKELLLYRNEL